MDFMAEARADEARARQIFDVCDADRDGVLGRAEYAEFLRRVEYLQGCYLRGVPGDPFAPRRGPFGPSTYRESALENAPALVPGPVA
jgi:hypothetical protein